MIATGVLYHYSVGGLWFMLVHFPFIQRGSLGLSEGQCYKL